MKIAVLSDMHANIYALEAVLRDIQEKQVEQIYCTGDLVGYAPFPNEVIELIRQRQIPTVMGNYDDGVGFMRFICGCDYKDEKAQALGEQSIVWTKTHTTEENKEFLRNLPQEIRFKAQDKEVLLVHGSPNRLNEYLFENVSKEYLEDIIRLSEADILICGHTHKPYHLVFGERHLINAGSVGKPKHGDPQAVYVTIKFDQSVKIEFHKVSYDFEAVATAIEKSELPNEFADIIRTGV